MSAPQATKVAICIPSRDDWKADFGMSVFLMTDWTRTKAPEIDPVLINVRGSILPRSRHLLVRAALANGATHVLFLDSDMMFPADTLLRLLAHGKSVVGAIYPERSLKPASTAFVALTPPTGAVPLRPDSSGGLVQVAAIGAGILLVEAEVFRRLSPPWFLFRYSSAADAFQGEDIFFCERLRDGGIPIYADLSFSDEIGHVGAHVYKFGEAVPDARARLKRPGAADA